VPPNGLRYALSGYWWAGRDNAALTEPTSGRANCLKTRTQSAHHYNPGALPGVGCTLCWACFVGVIIVIESQLSILRAIKESLSQAKDIPTYLW